jgi:cell fate regulator YaaT (PSP1 superfamily)
MSDREDIVPEDELVGDDEDVERGQSAPSGAAPPGAAPAPDAAVYRVKIAYSSAMEFCACPPGMECGVGDAVVVPTKYGNELARVLRKEEDPASFGGGEIRTIVRKASPADISRVEENAVKEDKAFAACREKIEARGLEMKLVSAHHLLDEQKILFFFTAENRIDFRELVKDLVAVFKMRIELRQIGVRDEARVTGGIGICGRVLCCNSITDRLRPVSIKMAKEQNLTLNSMKISGPCGRLLCCLSYEFDVYREARQQFPALGTRVSYDGEEFKVSEMNVLARRVRFQSESGRVLDLGFDSLTRNPATNSWEIKVRAAPGA